MRCISIGQGLAPIPPSPPSPAGGRGELRRGLRPRPRQGGNASLAPFEPPLCGQASRPRRMGKRLSPAIWACVSAPPYGQASRPAVWAYITPCRTGIHLSPAVRAYAASWAACTSERRCCGAGSSTCAHRHGIALCRHTSEIHLAPISPKNIPLSIIGKGDACFYSICSGAVIISGSGGKMFSSKTQM